VFSGSICALSGTHQVAKLVRYFGNPACNPLSLRWALSVNHIGNGAFLASQFTVDPAPQSARENTVLLARGHPARIPTDSSPGAFRNLGRPSYQYLPKNARLEPILAFLGVIGVDS
jgi:hypothetical protein